MHTGISVVVSSGRGAIPDRLDDVRIGECRRVAEFATLDDVEKQLGVARRSHAALHKHHAEDVIDPKTAMTLAQQVNEALRSAHGQHDKLMKQLHETESSVGN